MIIKKMILQQVYIVKSTYFKIQYFIAYFFSFLFQSFFLL